MEIAKALKSFRAKMPPIVNLSLTVKLTAANCPSPSFPNGVRVDPISLKKRFEYILAHAGLSVIKNGSVTNGLLPSAIILAYPPVVNKLSLFWPYWKEKNNNTRINRMNIFDILMLQIDKGMISGLYNKNNKSECPQNSKLVISF
ncbi:MAG: hypothetical protein WC900_09350 [Oscillospiraceae bacterium]